MPLLPSASDPLRQGIVRILNHSDEAGDVVVVAIDDSGAQFGPVTLNLQTRQALQFSAGDLERGNAARKIATGIGAGRGDWRLVLESALDIEPFAYVRTESGFVDGLNDTVPRSWFYHSVSLPAPSGPIPGGGRLRLIDGSGAGAQAFVFGVDEAGRLAPGSVSAMLPGGGARTFDARALERGAPGLEGHLGDGKGDWRLYVFADGPIEAMALLDSPVGPLANLSGAAVSDGTVPWFPSAGQPLREGLLRIRSWFGPGQVRIHGIDDAGRSHGPAVLDLLVRQAVTLDSHDLEHGNAAKGFPVGIGVGEGDWRLRLESPFVLDAEAFVRTPDGFLTSIRSEAAQAGRRHYLPWFIPAGVTPSSSRLRLVNSSDAPAEMTILAWDDESHIAPGGAVRLTLPPGASRSIDAGSLEAGAEGLVGYFGRGRGSWRLAVRSDRDIRVMNLMESAEGHITVLPMSLAPSHFPDACFDGEDTDGNGIGDECEADSRAGALELTVAGCTDGRYIDDPGNHTALVSDCRVLVGIARSWAGGSELPDDHALRRWGAEARERLESWEGIDVENGRVTGIDLSGDRAQPGSLSGIVPPGLGQLTELTSLNLSYNRLSGPIPASLGQLTALAHLDLSFNRLSGSIPAELAEASALRELDVSNNRLTGAVPWAFRVRVARGDLAMRYDGNVIVGLEAPPPRNARPVFSGNRSDNGNASHHSVAIYQGPLVWEWNWRDEPVEHQRPVLGRWAVLAVRIEHEVSSPPPVETRVLDGEGAVLAERLAEAAPPTTVATASGRWRTEYAFELPGEWYRAGHRIVHEIDPDDDMPETNEADNVGEPIVLYGVQTPPLRITFIPMHFPGEDPPALDAALLMRGIGAWWPVADEFEATVGAPLETDATNQFELLDEVRARWNAEADPDEFYHGVFVGTGRGGRGIANRPGYVAASEFSELDTIPHEFGHNLGLRHPPGCSASNPDELYPYPDGKLGPLPGWDPIWRLPVSDDNETYSDVMSYCGRHKFVSDYHYRNALQYLRSTGPESRTAAAGPFVQARGAGLGPASANMPLADAAQTGATSRTRPSLALSGRIDASGQWRLTHALASAKGPRSPAPDSEYRLVLLDADGGELYSERLSAHALSHGNESGWAARIPNPPPAAREVAILNPRGAVLLREALPLLDDVPDRDEETQ